MEKKSFPLMIDNILIENIKKLTNEYCTNNKKMIYLKKSKKEECSKYVWKNITPSKILIESTIFINENKIYINYPIFKLYVHNEIYDIIINYIMNCILKIKNEYNNYEIHININGFTISAAQRYYEFINNIFNILFNVKNINYLYKIYIYNPPSTIEYLKPLFINITNNNNVKDKIIIFYS